jgi:hypothetical protein
MSGHVHQYRLLRLDGIAQLTVGTHMPDPYHS